MIFNLAVGIFLRFAILTDRSNLRATCIVIQVPKFRPNQPRWSTSYTISRWRPRRLNTTSGFVFNVVTLPKFKIYLQTKFHRHISIYG